MSKKLSVAITGTPEIMGSHKGFIEYIENKKYYCTCCTSSAFGWKNLNEGLDTLFDDIIKVVNKIKSISLHGGLFRQLCIENYEDYNPLQAVHWSSSAHKSYLNRF